MHDVEDALKREWSHDMMPCRSPRRYQRAIAGWLAGWEKRFTDSACVTRQALLSNGSHDSEFLRRDRSIIGSWLVSKRRRYVPLCFAVGGYDWAIFSNPHRFLLYFFCFCFSFMAGRGLAYTCIGALLLCARVSLHALPALTLFSAPTTLP